MSPLFSIFLSRRLVHFQEISFHGDTVTLVNQKSQKKTAKRQALDGLWIEYAWSVTNTALHIRINHVQIDNQLDYTIFPVVLYPIISKATGTDLVEKPFIELSVYESKTTRSNVMQFKYFKLLIQEFVVKIDQGLIVSILAFLRAEKVRCRFRFLRIYFFFFFRIEFIRTNDRYGCRFRTNR